MFRFHLPQTVATVRSVLPLVPDLLWTDHAEMTLFGLPIGRRVAVARGDAGQLIVFSPLEATAENLAALRALGSVAAFIVPSQFHDSFYDGYFAPFAGTPFLAPADVIETHATWPLTPLEPDLPELTGFRYTALRGMPRVQEHVFLHERTRTLIVADSLFNLPRGSTGLKRMLLSAAGMANPPGPTRLFRSMIKDRAAFTASVREVLTWDFDRIVVGHGNVIESGGKAAYRHAYREWLAEK